MRRSTRACHTSVKDGRVQGKGMRWQPLWQLLWLRRTSWEDKLCTRAAVSQACIARIPQSVHTWQAVFHLPHALTATAFLASEPSVAAHSLSADIVISRPMMTAYSQGHVRAGWWAGVGHLAILKTPQSQKVPPPLHGKSDKSAYEYELVGLRSAHLVLQRGAARCCPGVAPREWAGCTAE